MWFQIECVFISVYASSNITFDGSHSLETFSVVSSSGHVSSVSTNSSFLTILTDEHEKVHTFRRKKVSIMFLLNLSPLIVSRVSSVNLHMTTPTETENALVLHHTSVASVG